MSNKITQDVFIARSLELHGEGKYGYDKVRYEHRDTLVIINCRKCGKDFEQSPRMHMRGSGCQRCSTARYAAARRLDPAEFIKRAEAKYGTDRFDYSETKYVDMKTKVRVRCILCDIVFSVLPGSHIRIGPGCPICWRRRSGDTQRATREDFIRKSEARHGVGKFDYQLVEYKGAHAVVTLICLACDTTFQQVAATHTNQGAGCSTCAMRRVSKARKLTQKEFVQKAISKHGPDKFDYSLAQYDGYQVPVTVKCLECNGLFECLPDSHLNRYAGCPLCRQSKGEREVASYLRRNGLEYKTQQRFPSGLSRRLAFDFSLEYNKKTMLIEVDGIQHFIRTFYNRDDGAFASGQQRDLQKTLFAIDSGYMIVRLHQTSPTTTQLSGYMDTMFTTSADLIVSDTYLYQDLINQVRTVRPSALIVALNDSTPSAHQSWDPDVVKIIHLERPTVDLSLPPDQLPDRDLWKVACVTGNNHLCSRRSSKMWKLAVMTDPPSGLAEALEITVGHLARYILDAC